MSKTFNLRLARYKRHVQKVAVHGDQGSLWRMQYPQTSGPTSPLVNPNVGNWAKDKPTPSGTTNLDDEKSKFDNVQQYMTDEERQRKINEMEREVAPPPSKLFIVRLKDGYQMTPELAKEVEGWKTEGGNMYVTVTSPEEVEKIRDRVRKVRSDVIVEEKEI